MMGTTRVDHKTVRPIVLLVEDNLSDVKVIATVLRQCGIPVDLHVSSDGEEAISVLSRSGGSQDRLPSLILLDWNLPRVSGSEVLAHIRQSDRLSKIPVVVVTSTNSPSDVGEIKRLGATAHFRKPTDLDAYLSLKTIVAELLSKSPQTSS